MFLLTNMGLFDEARRSCDAALASDIDDQRRGRLLVASAYVEATQDGTSDFRLHAADALRYLTPGDGVWSAALGMTSVVEQMFAPDRAVPALQEAIASIDDQASAPADHDRAVLGFYLGGALMNQRAYELAAETQLEAARRLEVIEPTSLVRLWTGAGAAMSFTMLGQLEEASAAIDEVSGLAGWTDWSADWYFAACRAARASRTDRRGARGVASDRSTLRQRQLGANGQHGGCRVWRAGLPRGPSQSSDGALRSAHRHASRRIDGGHVRSHRRPRGLERRGVCEPTDRAGPRSRPATRDDGTVSVLRRPRHPATRGAGRSRTGGAARC